jgi:RNA polymerase sigma factor (sigma-70 family)
MNIKGFENIDDKELLVQFREPAGQRQAFNTLIKKYQQRVYWHIRKMVIDHDDADDLTQETFVKVWRYLPEFRGDAQLFTWIFKIATNECLSFLSAKRKRFFLPIHDVEKELAEKLSSSDLISGTEIQLKLQKAILTLPEKQRLVFNMKYFDEMTYEDISEIVGTSVGALKASYHLAVKKIEDYLKRN